MIDIKRLVILRRDSLIYSVCAWVSVMKQSIYYQDSCRDEVAVSPTCSSNYKGHSELCVNVNPVVATASYGVNKLNRHSTFQSDKAIAGLFNSSFVR